MNEYITIQLKNNEEFVIVDMIDYSKKKYFLVIKSLEEQMLLDNSFKVCIYDEQKNSLKTIQSEEEYNFIYSIFESRLEQSSKLDEIFEDMIKTKIVSIDGFNYILETTTGYRLSKNILFYIDNKPKVNDCIYMSKSILNEVNTFQYGEIYDLNKITMNEIIKVEIDNDKYILQRYYG